MANKSSKPITVKITSAAKAMDEINRAVNKALGKEESSLNKEFRNELKLQSKMATEEDQLNLAGTALNGPPIGITIPTVDQLFVPLRTILQQTSFYPCDANPFSGATDPSTVDTKSKASSYPQKTPIGVLNFNIQLLMYNQLNDKFKQLLANYSDSSDASLEEEIISYLQKQVTTIIEQNIKLSVLAGAAASNSNQDVKDALNESKSPGVTAKITQIENQYVDNLNGFNSTVFPPPGGKDFLTNLENLIVSNINSQLSAALSSAQKSTIPNAAVIAQLKGAQLTMPLVRAGIDSALFDQISMLGIQGALLADALDNELSTAIRQNLTSLLNFLDDYKIELNNSSNMAMAEAQGVLNSKSAVMDFIDSWDVAQDTLNANEETLQSGSVTYTTINSLMNGSNNNNRAYLAALIYDNLNNGGPQILDNAESLSTQISAELAGTVFMSNATLNKQSGLNQVAAMDKTISENFTADIATLKTAFEKYASAMAAYLKTAQEYSETESMVDAALGVESQIRQVSTVGSSLNPTFS